MLAFAESEAEVLKALEEDVYFKEDVWDWHKVQIQPVSLDVPSYSIQSVRLTIISSNLLLGSLYRVLMSSSQDLGMVAYSPRVLHHGCLSTKSFSISSEPATGARIQSKLRFQILLFEHSFCNHSALNLASRCFRHDVR